MWSHKILQTTREDAQAPLHALVVDDSLAAREWSAHCLGADDAMRVSLAATADEALAAVANLQLDVILVDLSLPGSSGHKVIRALRALGDATPIIALAGPLCLPDSLAALRAGADAFITKPITREKFHAATAVLPRRPYVHA